MSFSMRLGWLLITLAWACGSTLPAVELEGPDNYRYGIRLLAAMPRQDFRVITGRTGIGVGLFAESELSPAAVLQTRIDYLSYPQTNQPGGSGITAWTARNPITLAVNSAALGIEIRHGLGSAGLERVSLLGGVMGIRYEFDSSAASTLIDQNGLPVPGITRVKEKTSIKVGLALGVAFELRRGLALAERFTSVNIDGTTLGTLETSLSYRF